MRHLFWLALLSVATARPLVAQRDTTSRSDTTVRRALETVRVTGRIDNLTGVATSASEGRIGRAEFAVRPLMREGELLEAVPGVIVTQHSGDGKANQLFVRGFNLDHGTDFRTQIEGMPINLPSHAHGQGYTDLNFLIPEFVDHISYRLGVHHTSQGDFGSAGGAEFSLVKRLAASFASLETGQFGYRRAALGQSLEAAGGTLLFGGDFKSSEGPWEIPQQLNRASGLARYTRGSSGNELSVLALAYNNNWNASDQIPLRAVESGTLSRFGQIDPTLGGASSRYSLSTSLTRVGTATRDQLQIYAIRSSLDLFSNFTYTLDNPILGDQFNQQERRTIIGASWLRTYTFSPFAGEHLLTTGVEQRTDLVDDAGLHRTRRRQRVSTVRKDDIRQTSAAVTAEIESRWTSQLRTAVGVRMDGFAFRVNSDDPDNSGSARDAIVSPKLSFIYAPTSFVELYASGGTGFHSNDARGTTIRTDPVSGDPADPVDPLVRSRGAELGLRLATPGGLRTTLAAWALSLDSELLFVGDGGSTEASDASSRRGATFANYYRPKSWLALDADISLARARFVNVSPGSRFIPGAIERVVAAGITLGEAASGPYGALRVRHFGEYPLIEDNSVRATAATLVNGDMGIAWRRTRIQITALNLGKSSARDIQYFYASRLANEPEDGVEDVHFHPVEPRQLRLSVQWRW